MFFGRFKKLPRKIRMIMWAVIIIILLMVVGYFGWLYFGTHVPSQFSEARQSASGYAQTIADALKGTPENLQNIQQLEKESKDDQALSLLVDEVNKNQAASQASVDLSSQLEIMAQSIPDITPKRAAESALVAVSAETQLIYKLVSFNDYMAQLLKLLQDKITNKIYGVDKINVVVDAINGEVDSINQLNSQFQNYIKTFDGGLN